MQHLVTLLPVFLFNMFCGKCQSFWDRVTSQVQFVSSGAKWPAHAATIHNDFTSLRTSSDFGCPPCRAIFQAFTSKGSPAVPVDTTVLFELDPHDGLHPVLSAELRTSQGDDIVPKFIVAEFSDVLENDNFSSALSKCSTLENQDTGSDSALKLAHFWVNECLSNHQKCSLLSSQHSFIPTRVLDLGNGRIRLFETRGANIPDRSYISLSHCWGKTQMFTTTKETLGERCRGIRIGDLSKTFQDAVQTTRKLGYQYLWIDSLCIIQDDSQDWERESAQMCQVYSNAVFNIAAAHASDGLMGCFAQRDGLLNLPFSVPLARGKFAVFTLFDLAKRLLAPGVQSATSRAEPGPPLFGRAWVFQEQILSRRMLIFNNSEISWECLCAHGTERYPVERVSPHAGFHKSLRDRIAEDGEYFKEDAFARRIQHWDWCNAVMDYTHRGMTYSSDRLIAITGISDAIQRKTTNQFLAGLWRSEFWLGLLWSIPHGWEFAPTTIDTFANRAKTARNPKDATAPTWSWVSVARPIVYPNVIRRPFLQQICTIGDIEVRGSSQKKSGAMEICGHTRTAYIKPIYPYAFGKDSGCPADMTFPCPDGSNQEFVFQGASFHPNAYFIYSDQSPARSGNTSWRLMRGMWRPDEVVPPDTPITFLAIAQQNHREGATQHRDDDPLQVYTIGLIPTNEPDKYRRVGYAVWDDCAWYGYQCGSGIRYDPVKTESNPQPQNESILRTLTDKFLELFGYTSPQASLSSTVPEELIEEAYPSEKGFHNHEFEEGRLPELSRYHGRVQIRIKTLQVV